MKSVNRLSSSWERGPFLSCWEHLQKHPKLIELPTGLVTLRSCASSLPLERSKTSSSTNLSSPVSSYDAFNFNLVYEDEVNLGDDDVQYLPRPLGRRSKKQGEYEEGSSSTRADEETREDVEWLQDMFGRFEIKILDHYSTLRVNTEESAQFVDSYRLRKIKRDILSCVENYGAS